MSRPCGAPPAESPGAPAGRHRVPTRTPPHGATRGGAAPLAPGRERPSGKLPEYAPDLRVHRSPRAVTQRFEWPTERSRVSLDDVRSSDDRATGENHDLRTPPPPLRPCAGHRRHHCGAAHRRYGRSLRRPDPHPVPDPHGHGHHDPEPDAHPHGPDADPHRAPAREPHGDPATDAHGHARLHHRLDP
ncbi:hypothetical protein SGPA1_30597 [Streptomyces misionensis JCM 4497]